MSGSLESGEQVHTNSAGTLIRFFGWGMIAVLAGFLINNVLTVGYGYPGLAGLATGEAGAWTQAIIYGAFVLISLLYVLRSSATTLRLDSERLHNFNAFLIRAAFWSVFLCGLVDAFIALGRVESFFSGDFASNVIRSSWLGIYVHLPLIGLGIVLAFFTRTLGFQWLALLIIIAELLIVISRFVFSYEQALMADLVRYWYAALFLFASAYTLYEDGHVRVDILYAGFSRARRGLVNSWGSILLGMTTAWVILWIGFNGKQSIINSPVMNFEVTQSGTSGMYIKYQMAAFIGIFAITMLIQFISYMFEAFADYRGEPGHREIAAASAH